MNDIIQKPKGLILPDGSVKPVGEQPQQVFTTPDGQEIVNPVVVAKDDIDRLQSEYMQLTARVRAMGVMRDAIITLRAAIENELNIFEQRGEISLSETGIRDRLADVMELVEKMIGPKDNGNGDKLQQPEG